MQLKVFVWITGGTRSLTYTYDSKYVFAFLVRKAPKPSPFYLRFPVTSFAVIDKT